MLEKILFPSDGERDMLVTSNEKRDSKPLKRATITLPPQARVLQKVTIEFKNLDGSIENKSIELDNAVDWHLPLFISQSYAQQDSSIQSQTKVSTQKTTQKKELYKNIVSIKHLSLSSMGKNLKLTTTDEIIRNFLLVNPHRVVIDFKKDTDIKKLCQKNSE